MEQDPRQVVFLSENRSLTTILGTSNKTGAWIWPGTDWYNEFLTAFDKFTDWQSSAIKAQLPPTSRYKHPADIQGCGTWAADLVLQGTAREWSATIRGTHWEWVPSERRSSLFSKLFALASDADQKRWLDTFETLLRDDELAVDAHPNRNWWQQLVQSLVLPQSHT